MRRRDALERARRGRARRCSARPAAWRLLAWRVLSRALTAALDGRELVRNLYKMGVASVPIVVLTAFFTGGIMVIQSGIFVKRFGAYGLLGWGAGYADLARGRARS